MTRWFDGQADVLREMGELLACPDLDAEELGRVLLTLEAFVRSGLVTQADADAAIADRIWRAA